MASEAVHECAAVIAARIRRAAYHDERWVEISESHVDGLEDEIEHVLALGGLGKCEGRIVDLCQALEAHGYGVELLTEPYEPTLRISW